MIHSAIYGISLAVLALGAAQAQWVPAGSAKPGATHSESGAPLRMAKRVQERSSPAPSPESLLETARQLERQGERERARRIYLLLTEQAPKLATPFHRLALMACRQTDFDVAEQYFQQAASADPLNGTILNDWGYMRYLQDDLVDAERLLRLAESVAPQDGRIQNNLGVVLGRLGRLNESFQAFRKGGTEAEAYANIAFVHVRRGELKLAEESYKRAVGLDPNLKSAAEALGKLTEIRPPAEATLVLSENSSRPAHAESRTDRTPERPTPPPTDHPPGSSVPVTSDSAPPTDRRPDRQIITTTRNGSKIISFEPRKQITETNSPRSSDESESDRESNTPLAEMIADEIPPNEVADRSGSPALADPQNPILLAQGELSEAPQIVDQWTETTPSESRDIIRAFINGLKDTDPSVRRYSAMTLACYGPKASAAVPALAAALDDPEAAVQEAAAIALAEVGPTAEIVVPRLLRKLKSGNTKVVSAAAWSIEKLGNSVPQRSREVQAFYQQATELLDRDSSDGERLAAWLNRPEENTQESVPRAGSALGRPDHQAEHGGSLTSLATLAQFARDYPVILGAVLLLQVVMLAVLVFKVGRHRASSGQVPVIASNPAASSAEYRNVVVIQQAATAPHGDTQHTTVQPTPTGAQIPLNSEIPSVIFSEKAAIDQRLLRTVFDQNRSWQKI